MRSLAAEYRRKRSRITPEMSLAVKAEDLTPFLGKGWAIARKTPANLERYARCITHAEYEDAVLKAFKAKQGDGFLAYLKEQTGVTYEATPEGDLIVAETKGAK